VFEIRFANYNSKFSIVKIFRAATTKTANCKLIEPKMDDNLFVIIVVWVLFLFAIYGCTVCCKSACKTENRSNDPDRVRKKFQNFLKFPS